MKHIQAKMSITHLVLVCSQAMLNQMACTPPNPTSEKHRYHTAEPYILQIAPTIFKVRCLDNYAGVRADKITVPSGLDLDMHRI